MRRALLFVFACFALSSSGCGPSFWTEVQYQDGRNQLPRPLPEFLVGRDRDWVIPNLGEPDEILTGADETLVYKDRDFDLLGLQINGQETRDDDLLTSYIEDTRYVSGMDLVLEEGKVRDVVHVVYNTDTEGLTETLSEILTGREKSWIIGQLGPPDVILPRMGGDTFVYRNRSLDLWVLRVRPTFTNNPAIYTQSEGTRSIRRLNIYFDRDGMVRNVSFPQGSPSR
jgi:hypothetical protein